jgi:hypothetical protein
VRAHQHAVQRALDGLDGLVGLFIRAAAGVQPDDGNLSPPEPRRRGQSAEEMLPQCLRGAVVLA